MFNVKKKKLFIIILVILLLGVVIFKLIGSNNNKNTNVVSTTPVTKGDIESNLSIKAPLEGTESIEVVSRLHQEIKEIKVKEGDHVTAGQVIAKLDTDKIEKEILALEDNIKLLEIQRNESDKNSNSEYNLSKAQLEEKIKNEQADYEKALESLADAQRNYDNTKSLFAIGGETVDNMKKAELALNDAKREIEKYNVENNVVVPKASELQALNNILMNTNKASTQKSIEIAQRDLERKKEELEECEIKSSINGTVTRVNSKVGRFADDTEDDKPMFVIENIENLQMKASISEYDIKKVKVGQKVKISAEILGDSTVDAVVSRISPTGEVKSGGSERIIPIVIDITDKNTDLIAGINAKASILVNESKDALLVPLESVYDNNDGTYSIYKVNSENKIEIIPVELGVENDTHVEIIGENINEGDLIIDSPDGSLTENAVVSTITSN